MCTTEHLFIKSILVPYSLLGMVSKAQQIDKDFKFYKLTI